MNCETRSAYNGNMSICLYHGAMYSTQCRSGFTCMSPKRSNNDRCDGFDHQSNQLSSHNTCTTGEYKICLSVEILLNISGHES